MARYLGFNVTTEDNFYFVSYNSEDSERIAPLANKINSAGIPLWYDQGLVYGEKWEEMVGEKITNCLGIIFFFTEGMLKKEDSYALKEYRIAKKQGIKIYILMVDELKDSFWSIYSKKSYFLDDIEQTQFSSDVNVLIDHLLQKAGPAKPAHTQTTQAFFNPSQPVVVDSEFLLTNNIFSAREISERHVELDLMTIDPKLFPEALEAEGDASTWEEMITETAECSANLIINNRIVGYMDLVPVSPEDYDKLKTQQFDDSYVAFFGFGGRFDIFVSMFSIDPNYSIVSNYILFIKWMIGRIIEWKDRDINIGRIEFSIYSKLIGKALENLGFKLVLTSQLKGMLYEIKVEDLLFNRLTMTRFGTSNCVSYKYHSISKDDPKFQQCKEIMYSLHVNNGGILQYEEALDWSDAVICASYKDVAAGYVCLKEYDILKNCMYVEQIAVAPNHQKLGIGSRLLKEAIKYVSSFGCDGLVANCKKVNEESKNALQKAGFELYDMSKEEYLAIGFAEHDIEKNLAFKLKIK